MKDSKKMFPEQADYYYQRRFLFHKDWYWYLPETIKQVFVVLSIITIFLFGYFLVFLQDFFLSLVFLAIFFWSGIAGAKEPWWMLERISDHFKYNTWPADGVNKSIPKFPSGKLAKFFIIVVASPINIAKWALMVFSWLAPPLIACYLVTKAIPVDFSAYQNSIFLGTALVVFSGIHIYGLNKILEKGSTLEDSILDGLGNISELEEKTELLNMKHDIKQLFKQRTLLVQVAFCSALVLIELLLSYFI